MPKENLKKERKKTANHYVDFWSYSSPVSFICRPVYIHCQWKKQYALYTVCCSKGSGCVEVRVVNGHVLNCKNNDFRFCRIVQYQFSCLVIGVGTVYHSFMFMFVCLYVSALRVGTVRSFDNHSQIPLTTFDR